MTQTDSKSRCSVTEMAILKSAVEDTYRYVFAAINRLIAPALIIDRAELRTIANRLDNNDSVWLLFDSNGVAHCAIQAAAAVDGRNPVTDSFKNIKERALFRSGKTASFAKAGTDLHAFIDAAPITAGGIHRRDWEMLMRGTLTERKVNEMMMEIIIGAKV